ncbi:MAG: Glu-tRNA(Gln) amidotransferase subunit GatD [Methanomassiliicoccaceae archaeon]|nr:Glu-tRNA(Gln) amidotransferase subunit GatD [Methanomassiliicoccaceae archaeon]
MRYSEGLSEMLKDAGAEEGSTLLLTIDGKEYKGVLMPHKDSGASDVVVIKLKNGYNIGLRVKKGDSVRTIERPVVKAVRTNERRPKEGLPNITLISTGGTIGSQSDSRTGAVSPGRSADALLDLFPEIPDIANIRTRDLTAVFSENMNIEHWQEIAEAAEEELNGGAEGVVILHGTDTMGYTAAALSFMLGELSGPVVLVGSQRSPDRPSSDAAGNITASVRFCISSKASGVYAVMHDTMNDDSYAVHRGTRVRKMHSSRRDAFRSINSVPVAHMDAAFNITFSTELPSPAKRTKAETKMCRDVVLLKYYPGMDPEMFRDVMINSKGIVIEGTGLGHVSDGIASVIKKAAGNGTVVVMTTQCINGPTGMNIYDTGRNLQSMGVIPAGDMVPETAYVKLMWCLANSKDTEEAKEMMRRPLSFETGTRRTADVIW